MNVKLAKGKWYVGLSNGTWSLGKYLGKSPTHYMFQGSWFSADSGWISRGLPIGASNDVFLLEVPNHYIEAEKDFMSWLQSALPE